jgi:hypothetical protein
MTDCDECLALQEAREERAGILQYFAKMSRADAEQKAREMHPDNRRCEHGPQHEG